jgi:hypothetical protein
MIKDLVPNSVDMLQNKADILVSKHKRGNSIGGSALDQELANLVNLPPVTLSRQNIHSSVDRISGNPPRASDIYKEVL